MGIVYNIASVVYNVSGLKEAKVLNRMRFEWTYMRKPWGKRSSHRKRVQPFIRKHGINASKYDSVLDIGCGYGDLCKELAKIIPIVVGIDISQIAINECMKGNSSAIFIRSNILDFNRGHFDLIVSNSSLSYLTDKQNRKAMANIMRMKPKRGIICE